MVPDIVSDIKLPLGHTDHDLQFELSKRTGLYGADLPNWTVIKKSIDARKKPDIYFIYTVTFVRQNSQSGVLSLFNQKTDISDRINIKKKIRPVVAGLGPAGLFAALYLAMAGQQPLVLERGRPVEIRSRDVEIFWNGGELDPNSNVQFGEGGAGTFSDGKLTTSSKDPRIRAILEELVLNGAPAEILYLAKPHIGTDVLKSVVKNIRKKIIAFGGEIRFSTCLTDLEIKNGCLKGIYIKHNANSIIGFGQDNFTDSDFILADKMILAPGHSARDTFEMLMAKGLPMQAKPFAIGARIEHSQPMVDFAQYGVSAGHPQLPPAEYKLSANLPGGRSAYTFCMCPGGEVIAAASEKGGIVTNGMSRQARDCPNANSAVLVNVTPDDFKSSSPLAGVYFQREWESKSFLQAGSNYRAPAQTVSQFLGISQAEFASMKHKNEYLKVENAAAVFPTYKPGIQWTELAECLPGFVVENLKLALPLFERKLHGFISDEAVLTGPESRSSSPVRIIRENDCQSMVKGIFPCGEGAGYAGGIMSAAVDGLRCAEAAAYL